MRLTGSRAYTRPTPPPKMPAGLVELMEGLTKDVLKNNPVDMYEFCAGHMQKLIDIRDGNLPKKQQMSLEEKIKRAQEKVRQRIHDRLLQRDDISVSKPATEKTNEDNPSNETQKQSVIFATDIAPEAAIPPEDKDIPKQPVYNGEDSNNEVEKFNETNVTAATANIVHEPLMDTHESARISTETEENKEKEVVKETKESFSDIKEDSPTKPDKLHVEEVTKEIETDVKKVNSESKDESITSETLHRDLTGVNEIEKSSENDVKPISSETYPIENSADKTAETTMVQSQALSEMVHVASDSSNSDKFTQNTENILLNTPVASKASDVLEKQNEAETAKESKDSEKILSTEFEIIEIVKDPNEENYIQILHTTVVTESITSSKLTLIDDDLSKKDDHDVENEKNMNEVQLAGQNTTNVNSEINYSEGSNDNKKGSKDKNIEEERLKNRTVEMNSSSKTGNSEMSTSDSEDVKENGDLNIKKVENGTVAETTDNLKDLKRATGFENSQNKKELPVVEGNVMKKIENASVTETTESLKRAGDFENDQNEKELPVVDGNVMKKDENATVAETTENLANLKRAAGFENDQNKREFPVEEENRMKKIGNGTVTKTVETEEHLNSAASFENGHKNVSHVIEGNVTNEIENATVAGTVKNVEHLKRAASFENGQNNKVLPLVEGNKKELPVVYGNVSKNVENVTVAETTENLGNLKKAANCGNDQNEKELPVVDVNVVKKVEDATVAKTTENLENLKRAAGFENDTNKRELPVEAGNVMKKVENGTVTTTAETLEHLKSAASFENGQNKNESHVVEGNVMKVENATVAETVENVEHFKRAARFENGQNNKELPLVEGNVTKKVENATAAEAVVNSGSLKSVASFEYDPNKNELPVVEGTFMKKTENTADADTNEKLEHLKTAASLENGQDNNELLVEEGNIIVTARVFLQHERQLSSELATEVSKVVSEKSTLENNPTGERDATIEPNSTGTGMDLETAAVTIQKVFRSFLFSKSRTSTLDDGVNENSLDEDIDKKGETEFMTSANLNKDRRALGISRMDTVLQTVNEEKSLSLSTDDSSTLSSAATTIQAHVRGFLVRNRLASYKTTSNSSLVNSEGPSTVSLDGEGNEPKKTILNIHIVPERGQFMSRDESILTSIDLPLDNSPPSSVNLHPLGYDKSEPRKQLKREDAIQSVSPPSNNSGKLSEEVDSVKENDINSKLESENIAIPPNVTDQHQEDAESCDTTLTISSTAETVVDAEIYNAREVPFSPEHNTDVNLKNKEAANLSSDEMDVVTPFPSTEKTTSSPDTESIEKPKLIHTGEFHDMVVQTQVKRSASSVVREFKNVLVYFLIWDKT